MSINADPFSAPAVEEVRFDQYGRYKLPDPETGRIMSFTRTTTFAKAASDDYLLSLWQQRMVAKGLTLRPDLYALAASTPIDDRSTLNKIAGDAKEAAGAKTRANLGTALHGFAEQYDEEGVVPESTPPELVPDVQAYGALVRDAGFAFESSERIVVIPQYGVAGKYDRLGRRSGEPGRVIVDLKTGRDLEYGWDAIAVQLAMYANAEVIWDGPPYPGRYEPMPADLRRDIAYVIHLPVGEARASLYAVDIEAGWRAARLCAEVRTWRKTKGLARPVAVSERLDHTGHEVIDGEVVDVEARLRLARSRAELSQVWRDAKAAGMWSPEHEQLGKARLREIEAA